MGSAATTPKDSVRVSPSRRRGKSVLAVRMLAAKVAWLDGRIRWQDGRVAWDTADGTVAPGPAELARAERSLKKIRSYPVSAGLALGDADAWIRERAARLEVAKRLSRLAPPSSSPRTHGPQSDAVLAAWAEMLNAEAFCVNSLPIAPSGVLLAAGERAIGPLTTLVEDPHAPLSGRALAALVLGAVARAGARAAPLPSPAARSRWIGQAHMWGLRSGLPADPALVVSLLAADDGSDLARRLLVLPCEGELALSSQTLRDLLAGGLSPRRAVELAEAVAGARDIAPAILQAPGPEPAPASRKKKEGALHPRQERRRVVEGVASLVVRYARSTSDPEVPALIARLTRELLALAPFTPDLGAAIMEALEAGLELPLPLPVAYLRLLVERRQWIWDPATMPERARDGERGVLKGWLLERSEWVKLVLKLLRTTGDPEIVRDAIDLRVLWDLARARWSEPALCRLFLTVVQTTGAGEYSHDLWVLRQALDHLAPAEEAAAALRPLLASAPDLPENHRRGFVCGILEGIRETRLGAREDLRALVPFFAPLKAWVLTEPQGYGALSILVKGALVLAGAVPDQAAAWLDWLLRELERPGAPQLEMWQERYGLRLGIVLGCAVSEGHLSRFQGVVRAALTRGFSDELEHAERGIEALRAYPAMREPLARLFPGQTERCLQILMRLGLVGRLGPAALGPLAELALPGPGPAVAGEADPRPHLPGWSGLLSLSPGMEPLVRQYLHAQGLLGGSLEVPPGARRALELPERLARELEYLERRLAEGSGRADLVARAASLRDRLAARERLLIQVREEAGERLEQIATEARLRAAEEKLIDCYRGRLRQVAGPVPPDLPLDQDLLNAILLTMDIHQNRRLLRRLLRAHLSGDSGWRERMPQNAVFLAALRERGVDVAAWLGAHPRRYPSRRASGGRLTLRLERDPLRILQMGNYFDTCLSFGQCNAYSTVANACELNKRVVFAADGSGRVVGRKLVGLDAEGRLVGFRTYTSLSDEKANRELRAVFRRYLRGFADRCGLELVDEGTIPRLLAEAWYDDGSVPWSEDEDALAAASGAERSDRREAGDAPA